MEGRLVVFEGIDHVGKSTIIQLVYEKLNLMGINASIYQFPGKIDRTLGKLVYDIHHERLNLIDYPVDPFSLQLLHIAAHIDLLNKKILPAIKCGQTVLLDRYWWSTLAYAAGDDLDLLKIKSAVSLEKCVTDTIKNKTFFYIKRKDRKKDFECNKENKIIACYDSLFEEHCGTKYVINNDNTLEDSVDTILGLLKITGRDNDKYNQGI